MNGKMYDLVLGMNPFGSSTDVYPDLPEQQSTKTQAYDSNQSIDKYI